MDPGNSQSITLWIALPQVNIKHISHNIYNKRDSIYLRYTHPQFIE